MRVGYACLTVGVADTSIKSCRMRNADEKRLFQITENNLLSLEHMLNYNAANNIKFYRISSDIIPFGSSPVNNMKWWDVFKEEFEILGKKIRKHNIRVSMHPGQYTVLNSPNEDVVKRAIMDLDYHARVLDALGTGTEHKIILHIGGIYSDKEKAIERFIYNYSRLGNDIKQRLVIENDDKSYNIADVLAIGRKCGIPVVFDNLHHKVNPPGSMTGNQIAGIKTNMAINLPDKDMDELEWINECRKTWKSKDGTQKIHYSQQDPDKKPGSHSQSIEVNEFIDFINKLGRTDIDIMLEVKDKNQSAIECIKKLRILDLI